MSWDGRIRADARQLPIADECIQTVVTSPPYWNMRKYDVGGPRDRKRILDRGIHRIHSRSSVWSLGTAAYPEAHYAMFPPDLVEPCILAGSRAGDIVLDPFAGSGTVGRVAEEYSRRWIGVDLGF